jgi:hypothetical protein
MKKLFTIILFSVTINAIAQQATGQTKNEIQNINQNKNSKVGKTLLVMSGASFVIGSLIAYNASVAKEPKANYTPLMVDKYNSQQKRSRSISNGLYGLGGALLSIGAVITF